MIRSKAIRDSARGEECTFQIPNVCSHNPEQTVLCHLPDESHGMGLKADDIVSAYGDASCHSLIDGRMKLANFTREDKEFYMRRAQTRTLRRLIEKGIVTIKGMK